MSAHPSHRLLPVPSIAKRHRDGDGVVSPLRHMVLGVSDSYAQDYTVTVPDRAAARAVADRLAERGHCHVAVRIVDHFRLRGESPTRPEYAGWWDVFTVVVDPAVTATANSDWLEACEWAAVAAIAREHGGLTSGPGGGRADVVFKGLTKVGLVHKLRAKEAERRRLSAIGAFPTPGPTLPPAPGLRYLTESRGRSEVLAALEIAQRMPGFETLELEDDGDDVGRLLIKLLTGLLVIPEAEVCYPETASCVPAYAELAADERLTDYHRAMAMVDLYIVATVGRQHLAFGADRLRALGEPAIEPPDEVAGRMAVAASLPVLAAPAGGSELTQFMYAALVAACPEAAPRPVADLEAFLRSWDGTTREPVGALLYGLAIEDPIAIDDALQMLAWTAPEHVGGLDSPYADITHRALAVLEPIVLEEFSNATS